MAALTLTATSSTITATVSGMGAEYAYERLFRWTINNASKGTSRSPAYATEHTNIFSPMLCGTAYSIQVEICNADGSEVFATLSGSISTPYAQLALWDWFSSNGTATVAQMQAAYEAITTRGQTNHFHRNVWNDIARLVVEMTDKAGLGWNSTYRAKDAVYLTADDYFYAKTANAIVQNIKDYPYFAWATKPLSWGYIGRKFFRGAEQYDSAADADAVYGDYFFQITKGYNVLAKIYSDSNYLRKLGFNIHLYLDFYADAPLRDPRAGHLSDTEILQTLSIPERELRDPAARHLSKAEEMRLNVLEHRLYDFPSVPMRAAMTGALSHVAGLVNHREQPLVYDGHLSDVVAAALLRDDATITIQANHALNDMSLLSALLSRDATIQMAATAALENMTADAALEFAAPRYIAGRENIAVAASGGLSSHVLEYLKANSSVSVGSFVRLTKAVTQSARANEKIVVGSFPHMIKAQTVSTAADTAGTITASGIASASTPRYTNAEEAVNVKSAGRAKASTPEYTRGSVTVNVLNIGRASTSTPGYTTGEASENVKTNAVPKTVQPNNATAAGGADVTSVGTMGQRQPKRMTANAIVVPFGGGTPKTAPSARMTGECEIIPFASGVPKISTPKPMSADIHEEDLLHTALLELQGTSTWEYPIEQPDGLLIRQVHLVWNYKDKAQIDWVEFLDVEASDESELTHEAGLTVSSWKYPDQYLRILTVYQSLLVTVSGDELTIN